jgi:hypothetical protein
MYSILVCSLNVLFSCWNLLLTFPLFQIIR